MFWKEIKCRYKFLSLRSEIPHSLPHLRGWTFPVKWSVHSKGTIRLCLIPDRPSVTKITGECDGNGRCATESRGTPGELAREWRDAVRRGSFFDN